MHREQSPSSEEEIKRLEQEDEKRRMEELEGEMERGEEERGKAVVDFERVMMGLEGGRKKSVAATLDGEEAELAPKGDKSLKRKFVLDEDEMLKNARAERVKARNSLDEEKYSKPTLPSFWVPSLTLSSNGTVNTATLKASKLSPFCPLLVKNPSSIFPQVSTLISPACKRVLSNTLKAMLPIRCGHILCKPCTGKFMVSAKGPPDPLAPEEEHHISCYVCDADLSGKTHVKCNKEVSKGTTKAGPMAGLVEINSEGTGFAGGGKYMAKKQGVAFQC
ncbi:hypothetical protein MMC29_002670 [Sticta canariensis]|nr:hypothetical protein [Sticta canariensis]